MDEPAPEQVEEEVKYEVIVVVCTLSRDEYKVPLGSATQQQVQTIHDLIRASFDTLSPTKALTFADQNGVTRHFNTSNVTCVEVKIS